MAVQPQTQQRLTREEIYDGVRTVLEEALGVEDENITLETELVRDLGAESIDGLDIIFKIERRFRIKILQDEFFPEGSLKADNLNYRVEDRTTYTPSRILEIKQRYSHLSLARFEIQPSQENLDRSITVGSIVNYLERKPGEQHG